MWVQILQYLPIPVLLPLHVQLAGLPGQVRAPVFAQCCPWTVVLLLLLACLLAVLLLVHGVLQGSILAGFDVMSIVGCEMWQHSLAVLVGQRFHFDLQKERIAMNTSTNSYS